MDLTINICIKTFLSLKILLVILSLMLFSNLCFAADSLKYQKLKISTAFIEMHTGPGKGYPIFHVIERGAIIEVILQRASWYKIKNKKGLEGWVHYDQISKTVTPQGKAIKFSKYSLEDFTQRNWEWGVLGGEFGGAPVFSTYGSYLINKSFASEVSLSQSIGTASSSIMFKLGMLMQPFPSWTYSPFFLLATGVINVSPSSTLIQPVDQNNQFSNVSIGIKTHLTQKIIVRLEYSEYVIFSATKDNDNNEDLKEWKLGFAIFF